MKISRLYAILFCLSIAVTGVSQNFKWLRSFGTKLCQESVVATFARPHQQTVCFVSIILSPSPGAVDTIVFDSTRYPLPVASAGDDSRSYIVRLDSNGHVITASLLGKFYVFSVCTDEAGNYYASVNNKFQYFKLDPNLNFVWNKSDGNTDSRIGKLVYSEGHLYFLASAKGTTSVGDSTHVFSTATLQGFYGEMDKNSGHISWSGYLAKGYTSGLINASGLSRLHGRIYMSVFNNTPNNYVLGTDTFSSLSVAIIMLDSAGRYKGMFKTSAHIYAIHNDGKNLFFDGMFIDTAVFGTRKITPSFTSPKTEFFVACISPALEAKWFYRPVILDQNAAHGVWGDGFSVVCSGDFLYVSALIGAKSNFNGFVVSPPLGPNGGEMVVLKMDIIGNVLWMARTYGIGVVFSIDAISSSQVCLSGNFMNDSLRMGPFRVLSKAYPGGVTYDGWVTNITDNAIVRGYISSGPYCAGDSMYIPFRKFGDFDTANTFIAEISDENGNFEGGERELGRKKTNTNDTVIGKLPMYRFGSSAKYRIRIRSTDPPVQSYYKVDTLRLLVYSRDKANPGRDTTICKGDSLKLETFGGTKWTWSPKYKMKDSTVRKTMAWPDKTTTYKIIIADSSGCGEADTAYKKVVVRLDPKSRFLLRPDTSVCMGGKMRIVASFSDGDSANYSWYWISITSDGSQNFEKSGSGKYGDTLDYSMPLSEKDSVLFLVYLSDNCSPKTGVARYALKVSKAKPEAVFEKQDSMICPGKPLSVIADFSKGYAPGYNWQWSEQNQAGQWLAGPKRSGKLSDTLVYTMPQNWQGTKKLRLVLKDNCSNLQDTSIFTVIPRDTLQLKVIPGDTVLCRGRSITWKAHALGGDQDYYQYAWVDPANGDTLSTTDSFSANANSSGQVMVSLSDGCMPKAASYKLDMKLYPELQSDIRDNLLNSIDSLTLCNGELFVFKAGGTGGKEDSYSFKWWLDGQDLGSGDSLIFNPKSYLADTGDNARLLLVLDDQCTTKPDSSVISIRSLPAIQSQVEVSDTTCFGGKAEFSASAKGGKRNFTFTWLDEDHVVLATQQDKLLYDHTDKTKQGVLKRYAITADGCSKPDTVEAITLLLAPLQLQLNTPDTCPVASANVTASSSGGKTSNRIITWWRDDQLLGNGSGNSRTINVQDRPVTCKAVLNDGCSNASDTSYLRIGMKPDLTLAAEPSSGCVPLNTRLHLRSHYASSYWWVLYTGYNRDSMVIIHDTIADVVYPKAGPYDAKAVMTTDFGCRATSDPLSIIVYPNPHADFSFSPNNPTPGNPQVRFTNLSSGASNYQWRIPGWGMDTSTQLVANLKDTGRYPVLLVAVSDKGCRDSMIHVVVVHPDFNVWIPNAFSPNDDGTNDFFGVHGSGIRQARISIFNRWGELIYYTEQNKPWDGKVSNKIVPEGVYVYKIDVQGINDAWKYLSGEFTLLR